MNLLQNKLNMRIDINQNKISIGDKYKIFINERQEYYATSELFNILAVINLFKSEYEAARLRIEKQWSFLKPKYNIVVNDHNPLEFRAKSFWYLRYQCQSGRDLYEIYGHRGRKYSVYKNDIQVAWWEKKAVTWFGGDNYTIFADSDSEYELIMAFCLIIDNYSSNDNEGNAVSIDFGNIGGQVRKFNPGWEPKQ
jgi:uncharacterized protein YxjI